MDGIGVKFLRVVRSDRQSDQLSLAFLLGQDNTFKPPEILSINGQMPDAKRIEKALRDNYNLHKLKEIQRVLRAEFSIVDWGFGARPLVDELSYEDILRGLKTHMRDDRERCAFIEARNKPGSFELSPCLLTLPELAVNIMTSVGMGECDGIPTAELIRAKETLAEEALAVWLGKKDILQYDHPTSMVLTGKEIERAYQAEEGDHFMDVIFQLNRPEVRKTLGWVKGGPERGP